MNKFIEAFSNLISQNKEEQFAVVITETGDAQLYTKKLRRLIKKYPWLQQNPSDNLSLNDLEYGDIILFGNSSSYDYTILEGTKAMMKLKNVVKYDVVNESGRIARALEHYVKKNSRRSSWFQPLRKSYNDDVTVVNITITNKPKPRVVRSFDVADIYEGFVKIGWNIYYVDNCRCSGRQFVNIDGEVFEIKADRFGDKYLA